MLPNDMIRGKQCLFLFFLQISWQFTDAVILIYSPRKQDLYLFCVYGTRSFSLKFSNTMKLILRNKIKYKKNNSKNKIQIRKIITFHSRQVLTFMIHISHIFKYWCMKWILGLSFDRSSSKSKINLCQKLNVEENIRYCK